MNPYKILGVEDNASKDVCKVAYRTLMRLNHPDAGGSVEKATELNRAYEMIQNGYRVTSPTFKENVYKPKSTAKAKYTHKSIFEIVSL